MAEKTAEHPVTVSKAGEKSNRADVDRMLSQFNTMVETYTQSVQQIETLAARFRGMDIPKDCRTKSNLLLAMIDAFEDRITARLEGAKASLDAIREYENKMLDLPISFIGSLKAQAASELMFAAKLSTNADLTRVLASKARRSAKAKPTAVRMLAAAAKRGARRSTRGRKK
jgi:hypothetical protein